MPGLCPNVSIGEETSHEAGFIKVYPNPGSGNLHFEGYLESKTALTMYVYDLTGRIIDRISLQPGRLQFDYRLTRKGVFFFTITNNAGVLQSGKLIVM